MLRSSLSSNLFAASRLISRSLCTTRVNNQEATNAESEGEGLDELFYNSNTNTSENQATNLGAKKRLAWGVNRVELLGGVAADPQFLTAKSGDAFSTFRMFTNVDYRKRDGSLVEQREVHEVQVFAPGMLNYLKNNVKKGSRVYVNGRLHYVERSDFSRRALIKADLIQTIAKNNSYNE